MHAEPGLRVGSYELIEKLGEGGMGVVWRARDTELERDVAIKFLPAAFAHDAERVARFRREAKAVAALSHPGILAIYGFGSHDGALFAVTELLDGRNLRALLLEAPLPAQRVLDVARQMARAIAAAHDRGIVHRDLKPENVFLTRDGHVKILDFGLATYTDAVEPNAAAGAEQTPTRTSLTTPGTVLGTIGYLSPEQVRGENPDARSDVFSFGTMLVELLAGRHPFRRATGAETMTAILREAADAPGSGSAALDGIVRRCLAKNPGERFASGRELAAALDGIREAEPRARRSRIRWAAIGAVVVGLAIVGAWLAQRTRGVGDASSGIRPPSASTIGEPPSPVTEANEYFEKGLLFLRVQFDIARARALLDRAVELDPAFGSARAMRALADLIALHEGVTNDPSLVYTSERATRQILAAQPDLASAHATLGTALLYLNRKEQARAELAAALRLNPTSQPAVLWSALDERHSGEAGAAEARMRTVLQEVPVFAAARIILAEILLDQGRFGEARREIDKVFELDAANVGAIRAMARLAIYENDTARARALLEPLDPASNPNYRVKLVWALLLAREGAADAALAALDPQTREYARVAMFAPSQVAEICALAGRATEALDWLDLAVRNGDEREAWLRQDPLLTSLRDEPRFGLILETIRRAR